MKILREDKSLSYGSGDNILVHGDNLEALKALLPFYAGEVKCIYIDPPYNTGSAFEHYDDNLEHSTWLNMMYPRLKLLREFLREDGSIWISQAIWVIRLSGERKTEFISRRAARRSWERDGCLPLSRTSGNPERNMDTRKKISTILTAGSSRNCEVANGATE